MNKGIILSVDDDDGLQIVLKQYLENDGYSVVAAKNGYELEEKLKTIIPGVILLDLVLPDTDGTSLISQIRAKHQTPIIVVSGKHDTTEKIVCLEMGADDYLTKPFEMRELSARIKAALRRIDRESNIPVSTVGLSNGVSPKIEMGSFILDRNQFQIFDQKGNSLNITTGEFQLIEALVMSPNRALSREQLFELTRDGNYDIYDRAIDIQIGKIRKKMGPEGSKLIKTIRGIGYMFCPTH